jgi:hypothetical protein
MPEDHMIACHVMLQGTILFFIQDEEDGRAGEACLGWMVETMKVP